MDDQKAEPTVAPHLAAIAAVKGPPKKIPPDCTKIAPHLKAHRAIRRKT